MLPTMSLNASSYNMHASSFVGLLLSLAASASGTGRGEEPMMVLCRSVLGGSF